MISREIWLDRLTAGWVQRPVVWLSGVRRVGKTTLTQMLPGANYLNCDLPSVRRRLDDPELFFDALPPDAVVIFDEVHRLDDPSLLLKIAADAHPKIRVLATGSSTLDATRKFRDALTGRKASVHLCPVPWNECRSTFGIGDLDRRLLHGGLPEQLLANHPQADFFAEWIDSFYARDIQELFGIRNRRGFLTLLRLLLRQSGGQLDYSRLASLSELSRPTVKAHVEAMRIAHAIHLLPPFHGGGKQEIVSRPKCYAFDTGFIAHERGWEQIREEDRGPLWEHLVLDALRMQFRDDQVFYWQDKSRREIDFVLRRKGRRVDLIECKINPDKLDAGAAQAFRRIYPNGDNFVAVPHVPSPWRMRRGGLVFEVCDLPTTQR